MNRNIIKIAVIAIIIIYIILKKKRHNENIDDVEEYRKKNKNINKEAVKYHDPRTREVVEHKGTDIAEINYFRSLFKEAFRDYTIRENVSCSDLGWDPVKKYKTGAIGAAENNGDFYPSRIFDFAFNKEGKTVALVSILRSGEGSTARVKNATATAERYNVPYINFYETLPNDRDYVVDRVQKILF